MLRHVAEGQMAEFDLAMQVGRQRRGMLRLLQCFVPVERLEDALAARHGAEHDIPLLAHRHDGAEQHVEELREQKDDSDRHLLAQHHVPAEPQDGRDANIVQPVDEGTVEALDGRGADFVAPVVVVDRGIAPEVDLFAPVKLHDLDAGKVLLQILVQPRDRHADGAVERARGAAEQPGEQPSDRHHRQQLEGQLR